MKKCLGFAAIAAVIGVIGVFFYALARMADEDYEDDSYWEDPGEEENSDPDEASSVDDDEADK